MKSREVDFPGGRSSELGFLGAEPSSISYVKVVTLAG